MTQEELGKLLKELGINTRNYYPKKSFNWNGVPSVGLFERELKEDFYFHNNYDNCVYKHDATDDIATLETDNFNNMEKFIIPLSNCEKIYPETATVSHVEAVEEEEEFVEQDDAPHREMTIRDYAAIKWMKPISNKPWLNKLISENKYTYQDTGPM